MRARSRNFGYIVDSNRSGLCSTGVFLEWKTVAYVLYKNLLFLSYG